MSIILIELPPQMIEVDETGYPDRDSSWRADHLRRYLSLVETLPAVGVRITKFGAVVTEGHAVLQAAKDLRRASIRAIVDPQSDMDALTELLRNPEVIGLDWAAIDAAERRRPIDLAWHVFFFARALRPEEQMAFEREIATFFDRLPEPYGAGLVVGSLRFRDASSEAEFQARTPLADERWFGPWVKAIERFHRETAPIASYQGRAWRRH